MLPRMNRRQCNFFVIAGETDDRTGLLGLHIDQKFNHTSAVRPAVDVIAKENKLGRLFSGIELTSFDEVQQLVQAAVNVADGIGPLHVMPGFRVRDCRS